MRPSFNPRLVKFHHAALCGFAAFLCAALPQKSSAATLVYENLFTNTSGVSAPVSSVGWNSYFGNNATIWSSGTNVTRISTGGSNPNTTPTGVLAFVSAESAGFVPTAAFTSNASFTSIDLPNNSTITWTMGNSASSVKVQLLVKVGSSWFVSNDTFSNTAGYDSVTFSSAATASVLQTFVFSTDASKWSSFTLTPNTAMGVGSPLSSDLSSGTISGIGFYVSNASSQVARLDTLQVMAVPEPAALVLAIAGFGFVLAKRLARKTADAANS